MNIPGSWILLIFVALMAAVALVLLHLTEAGRILHQKIPDRPHRRLLLASISFFVTFLAARLLVYAITHHIGPFGYVIVGGRHIHHLVWGILLLLFSGYATLAEAGTGDTPGSLFLSRSLSIAYGVGAALTLDEFAIWLNLDPTPTGPPRIARASTPSSSSGLSSQSAPGAHLSCARQRQSSLGYKP
ncbi:MAG TPA: hypothetical protein VK638_04910 [Edaphobacter sp.]|nr:hypothetical protein [Edaphobacter sp.]